MKKSLKKCLLAALVAASLLSGWQGLGAGYAGQVGTSPGDVISEQNVNSYKLAGSGLYMDNSPGWTTAESPSDFLSSITTWTKQDIMALLPARKAAAFPVLVAILDTGIDNFHEELVGRVAAEINFTQSAVGGDLLGHGTAIAGIIAADDENTIGIRGVSPESRLINVKVADDTGKCQILELAQGIIWAVDRGAKVINISIEIKMSVPELQAAVDYAWEKGAIIVAAAGNDADSLAVYPAYYDKCLAVTALQDNGRLAPLANYGDWVDIAAPGYKIYSLSPGNGYAYYYGTSFASAYISGVAAALFSVVTDENGDGRLNDEVRTAIETKCRGLMY